jgi:hypothetical protein
MLFLRLMEDGEKIQSVLKQASKKEAGEKSLASLHSLCHAD